VQLNKILISLGAEDVRLKNIADGRELSAAQLKDVLESLEKLAKLSESVRRHGGDFETFLVSATAEWSACAGSSTKTK
jgi:DNA gyrase subunit B